MQSRDGGRVQQTAGSSQSRARPAGSELFSRAAQAAMVCAVPSKVPRYGAMQRNISSVLRAGVAAMQQRAGVAAKQQRLSVPR